MAFGSWTPFRRGSSNMPARRSESSDGQGLSRLQDEMNRMMQDVLGSSWSMMPAQFFGDYSPTQFVPRMDVSEVGDSLRVSAELPGMSADDVEISCEQNRLRIHGEKRAEETREEEGYFHTERSFGSFDRTVPLPEDVDVDKAEAHFKDGVLTIDIPKVEGAQKSRKLKIKSE